MENVGIKDKGPVEKELLQGGSKYTGRRPIY